MKTNTTRYDLSDWLIHFFRDVDLASPSSIIFPELMGFNNIFEDVQMSSLFMLRCAIRHGRLWATWSYRNDRRTIYGHNPAVCFTEMPLAAFLESGFSRSERGEAMSQFALVFPKKDMFSIGSRPVIYGLDDSSVQVPSGKDGGPRIIDKDLLPEREQYRYVTFNLSWDRPVNWSHEREWRWPYTSDISSFEKKLEDLGVVSDHEDIPALELYNCNIQEIGVVVQTNEQAKWVTHDILTLIDRKVINRHKYGFVLVAESLPPLAQIVDPDSANETIRNSLIDLEIYFNFPSSELRAIRERVQEIISQMKMDAPEPEAGEYGECRLWILDNTSKLARAMIDCADFIVTNEGRYLVNLYDSNDNWNLRQKEEISNNLAKLIMSEFNVECGYFSVLNSKDPNRVPFYNSNHDDNRMFYNFSWLKN